MELIERINGLEGELKLVKAEIKTVLIDLRELMNNYENPFVNVEQLAAKTGPRRTEKREEKKVESRMREERIPEEEEEPEPEPEPELEVAPSSMSVARPDKDRARPKVKAGEKIDIFALTQLMKWADNSLATLGKDKLNELIVLYALTGRLPEETKELIYKIEDLSTADSVDKDKIEMKDCILAIYQLDLIVTGETGAQTPLLLSEDELERWLKAR